MSLPLIRTTLMTRLSAWAAAQSPVIPIAKEGSGFTKPADNGTFIEALLLPADTKNVTVDGTRLREFGDFQINIWVGDTAGAGPAEAIFESLKVYFPVVPKTLLPVSIETTLSAKRAISDNSGYRVLPCTLSYRCES